MASPRRPDFGSLLGRISAELAARDVPYMVIGGQAVLLHGEPRLTQDVDVTLGVAPLRLPDILAFCEAADLEPLPENVVAFVRETFVLPVEDRESGIRVDLIFSSTPYEAGAIARAVLVQVAGQSVRFAAAEDLVLHKLFAGRPRDLEDVEGVVRRQGSTLNWDYLERWAREFAAIPGREQLPAQVAELRSRG